MNITRKRGVVKVSVYVTPEQKKWLKDHPEFNLSGFIRPRLKKMMTNYNYVMGVD